MKSVVLWMLLSIFILCSSCTPVNTPMGEANPTQESSIIDGKLITSRSTPAAKSVVYFEVLNQANERVSYCSATLIAKNFILTAAHCLDPKFIPTGVNFNVVFANEVNDVESSKTRRVLTFKRHPDYNSIQKKPLLYDHDIALMMFAGEIPKGFAPVQIDTDVTADYSNQEIYVYGYGRELDYFGDERDYYPAGIGMLRRGVMLIDGAYNATPDRYFITASSPSFICSGDSGGPQFFNKDSVLKLIGVNSAARGSRLANGRLACRYASQATKVAPFSQWILNEQLKMMNRFK